VLGDATVRLRACRGAAAEVLLGGPAGPTVLRYDLARDQRFTIVVVAVHTAAVT